MNRYFYVDSEGKQKGTFSPIELKNENIRKETLVWTQGMQEWLPAEQVTELQFLFDASLQQETPSIESADSTVSQPTNETVPAMPKTWLTESLLVTIIPAILCSNILSLLGIVAIVKASQVQSFYMQGRYDEANMMSKDAGRWTKIAFWVSIGWILLLILLIVLAFVMVGSAAGIGSALDSFTV